MGKGVIGLTLHLGGFELAPSVLGLAGIPVSMVARRVPNPSLYAKIAAWRCRSGAELIDHRNGAVKILQSLREGRAIGVLMDRYSKRKQGVLVPLFGARCSTSVGLATLALKTGAPVVPFYLFRDAPDHHQAGSLAALQYERSGDRKRDIIELTARCNEIVESLIRCYPDQWMWSHRRFRYSPDLPGSLYSGRENLLNGRRESPDNHRAWSYPK